MLKRSIFDAAVLVVPHHRFRGGLILVVLIVLAALVYAIVRLTAHRGGHGPADSGGLPRASAGAGRPGPPEAAEVTATPQGRGTGTADGPAGRAEEHPGHVTARDVGPAGRGDGAGAPAPSRRRARTLEGGPGRWAVETHGLTKRFGTNVAVDGVELLVPRGCAFGYLGPNGAGKTTLIRTLLGLTRADSGTMALLGVPVPAERSRALARVGAIVDEPRFHGHLTGQENLQLLAAARGPAAVDRIGPALARVGLAGRAEDKVASYSMGMRQRLGVASCLLDDPELLILDEPMNGLDPAGMQEMRSMIERLVDEGRTVMLCSHLLDEVERTCDAVAIVDRGRVVRQGPIDALVRGANLVVHVGCTDPVAAARILADARIGADTEAGAAGVTVTLPAGSSRDLVADVNRRLVEAGISVYSLEEVRTTLESWFLSVTSRFGDQS